MKHFDKLKIWADTFENKVVRLIALWGSVVALIGFFPLFTGGIYYLYSTITVLANAAQHVDDSIELNTYQNFAIMQLTSAMHEEMDTKMVYGVELEESNNGDLWYITKVEVFGKMRPIMYSANLKHKSKRVSYTDMYGVHRWIKNK